MILHLMLEWETDDALAEDGNEMNQSAPAVNHKDLPSACPQRGWTQFSHTASTLHRPSGAPCGSGGKTGSPFHE